MIMRLMSLFVLATTLLLTGCGNDSAAGDYQRPFKAIVAKLQGGQAAPTLATLDQSGIATLRAALEADGQSIYLVVNPALKYTNLMAPYGQNGDVQTWASQDYETMSLRAGMLVATRGFGADLMSSTGPSVAQIAAGRGSTQRRYHYLDGADQPHQFDYACILAARGSDSVTVLGKSYATNKVTESCSGASGSFVNEYWFDLGQNLRQSSQMIAPGTANLILQRVID